MGRRASDPTDPAGTYVDCLADSIARLRPESKAKLVLLQTLDSTVRNRAKSFVRPEGLLDYHKKFMKAVDFKTLKT